MQRLIDDGDVLVNQRQLKPSYKLRAQDEIEVDGVQVPRIFLSAHSGQGVPALRAELAVRSGSVRPAMTLEADAELHDAAP